MIITKGFANRLITKGYAGKVYVYFRGLAAHAMTIRSNPEHAQK